MKFPKGSIAVLALLLLSVLSVQPIMGVTNESTEINATSENVVIESQTVHPGMENSITEPERTTTPARIDTDYRTGIDQNYQNELQRINSGEPQGSVYQTELPEYLYTWNDFSSTFSNVEKSPYLTSYHNEIIKVTELNQLETIVKVTSLGLTPSMEALFDEYHVKVIDEYPILSVYKIHIDARVLDKFIEDAYQVEGITYVQPSFYYEASFIPNDPEYPNQYGPQIIGMETAWDYQMGDISLLVAIIDTGIDYTHPDLGNYLPLGYDWVNNDDDPMDDHSHGTHVAGTVAATINNGLGVAGVADVSFFAEKFLDQFGFGSDIDGANAIIHAVDVGADILSNSWGGYGESQVLEDAVNYAIANGVIVVAAAGNGATSSPHYPAAYPDVIAVTATDAGDNFAGFSNFGDWIDIAAPGVNILSTVPWGYDYYSGTSMSTPHVSGLLALLMSEFPDYTPTQLENLLYSTAVDLGSPGWDQNFGWGRIDASSAIFGLQEFNVRASIIGPSIIPFDQPTLFSLGISNLGFADVSDVGYEFTIDGGLILTGTVPYLESGSSTYFDYLFYPDLGTYELMLNVFPVPGETVLHDNTAILVVEATTPVISPELGDVLMYGEMGGQNPYQLKWVITDTSDPLANIMELWFWDEFYQEEWWADTFTLNTYTREYSSIFAPSSGYLFPYWVQTDLVVGQPFDLFQLGAQDAFVVDEFVVDYYGEPVLVWLVDDGYEYVMFNQNDGVLIQLRDFNFNPIFYDLVYSNAVTEAQSLENLRTTFTGGITLTVGQISSFNVLVQNTGAAFQQSYLEFYVNGEFIGYYDVFIDTGEFQFYTFDYIPPTLGEYYLFIQILPTSNEFYLEDNFDDYFASIIELENYGLSYPDYEWYDAAGNGYNLDMYGDDVYTSVNLPFPFPFYDQAFVDLYVGSNGWMSFVDTDPWEYWTPEFPNSEFPYSVGVFWADLQAEGNVYAWVTPDFVVIEYNNYNYLGGMFAGTFEVVFFATGEILMQYQYVNIDYSTKGINYGFDFNYYTVIYDDLSGTSNFAGLFTRGGVSEGPDLMVGLNIPDILQPGEPVWVEAFVQNIGGAPAQYVYLDFFINFEWIGYMFQYQLLPGEVLSFSYHWTPQYEGQVEIAIFAQVVNGESNTQNNQLITQVLVGGYRDLAVFLDVQQWGTDLYIYASVQNYGQAPETNVELYIYINGEEIAIGRADELSTYEFFDLIHHVMNFEGPTEIAAFTPIRPYEDDPDNNLVVQYVEPLEPDAWIDVVVMDAVTGNPISSAYVFLGGQSSYYDGFTNVDGLFSRNVISGDYYIYIQRNGYLPFDSYLYVGPGETLIYEVYLDVPTGDEVAFIDIWVMDAITEAPIEGAEVNLSGNNFEEHGFTDQDGYFFAEVPLGEILFEISKDGYLTFIEIFYHDMPNGYYGYGISLIPGTEEPQELYILSPTEGEVVDGGLVKVYYDATNAQDINVIDVYVNGQWTTSVWWGPDMLIHVPVTGEGPNTITLRAFYYTGQQAFASVSIESTNLQHYMEVQIGDYYDFHFTLLYPDLIFTADFFFKVVDWVSQDEILLDLQTFYYEDGVLVEEGSYYLIVNVINGFIAQSDMWWERQHFFPFSGLNDPQNAQLGDSFPFWIFGDTLYVTGEDMINGEEVWLFTNAWGDTVGAVYKENGLHIWFDFANFELGEVVASSWIPGTIAPPTVSDEPDLTYELNSVGNSISWTVNSESPDMFSILLDGWEIMSGPWIDGDTIEINIDGLPLGSYEFQIVVQDTFGQTAFDFVYVTVVDTTPPEASTDDYISYDYGTTGNVIVIEAFDLDPMNYTVLRDWDIITEGDWFNDVPIEVNIDGLEPGLYEFYIFITDGSSNAVELYVTVEVIDVTPPTVRSLPDFSYELGSEDNYITWTVSGDPEGMYIILFDDELLESGSWVDGDTIEINVDGLETGRYNFTAIFEDMYGNSEVNTVLVYVIEDNLPPGLRRLPGFQIWMTLASLIVGIPVIRKRRAQA